MAFNPGHEFSWTKGFDNIVVGTQSQSPDFIDIFLSCGDHQDRDIFFCSDFAANLETIFSGKHNIQKNQINRRTQGCFFSRKTRKCHLDFKSIGFQIIPLQFSNPFIILDNQYLFHASSFANGNSMTIFKPWGVSFSAQMIPFIPFTSSRTTASPSPLPLAGLVLALSVR